MHLMLALNVGWWANIKCRVTFVYTFGKVVFSSSVWIFDVSFLEWSKPLNKSKVKKKCCQAHVTRIKKWLLVYAKNAITSSRLDIFETEIPELKALVKTLFKIGPGRIMA